MSFRDYQIEAVNAAVSFTRKCTDPFLVEIGTGGGKSHVIAGIASKVFKLSGKKVLVTAPTAEIVTSNYEKYVDAGYKANVFCASLKRKELSHSVTFGSPLTILNGIDDFSDYGLVLIDEPRNVTPTLRAIIDSLAEKNGGSIRVGGFSATPYATGTGYIYEIDVDGNLCRNANEPFFKKQVCSFGLGYLIENGWNLPPIFGCNDSKAHFKTGALKSNSSKKDENAIFEGDERATKHCMADIIDKTSDRHSVLIFAQTKQHAAECAASLPAGSCEIITEKTKGRADIIKRFEMFEFKYLINIAILGVGVNIPCIDAICIVRYTESLDLLVQIIGRGTRRYNGSYPGGKTKSDFIVLDYTDNFETHFSTGDFYNPKVTSKKKGKKKDPIDVSCMECGYTNDFSPRDNPSNLMIDEQGYFCTLTGQRIEVELPDGSKLAIPAHYGRRCKNQTIIKGVYTRCNGRWSSKKCEVCDADNDIAARYCCECKAEIINPNDKLVTEAKRMRSKSDPITVHVIAMKKRMASTLRGKEFLELSFLTTSKEWIKIEIYDVKCAQISSFKICNTVLSLSVLCGLIGDNISSITYKVKPRSTRSVTLVDVDSH